MDRAISLEARRVDLSIELPFVLGRARIDPPAHEITVGRRSERMQPLTMKVLVALHDKSGQVVTRDELADRCWEGRIVGEDVINRCILLLRRFADETRGFRIETVPRAGYRLVESGESQKSPRTLWTYGAAGAAALAAVAISAWVWLDRPPASQGTPPTPSVSILPFSAEPNDPLTRQLAKTAPLSISHMMAESGFAIVRDDPAEKGSPSTDYVFSGNVRRESGSVEAAVQLVSRSDGTVLYAHDFNAPLDRAADLPDRIGAAVAAELAWTGAQMVLDPREHLNPEIASELMKSIILTIEAHNDLRAYQLARHAAAAAPDSAIAQLGLAVQTGFSMSSIPQGERAEALALGRRAGDRARGLAPEFGDVYLPWCLLHSQVRMAECDAWVHHALEVDSSSSFVPGFLSGLLHDAGRTEESVQLAVQSLSNDPYKPAKLARMIRMDEASGRSDDAAQVYAEGRRLWPDDGRMRVNRLIGMAERGDYAALAAFAEPDVDGRMIGPPTFAALLAAQRGHDLAGVRRVCNSRGITDFTSGLCMTILAELGDPDRSFAIAARLYPAWHAPRGEGQDRVWLEQGDGFDVALLNAPAAQAMRADPRFLELAQRLGLVAYWRARGLPDFCTKGHEPVCARIAAR